MPFLETWHRMDADYFEVEYGEDFNYPAHIHRCYEAVLLLEGEMLISVDGVTETLKAGDVAFICPHQVHSLHTPTHSRHKLFIFAPELIAAFSRPYAKRIPRTFHLTPGQSAQGELLRSLEREDGPYAVKGALYCLCDLAERKLAFVHTETERRGKGGNITLLREILSFVQENFKDECTLSSLARAVKYDMTYLSKFFTANVGVSFTSYVTQVRITHASYLLLNTDRSVIDISHECGNWSLRSFNRNFLALRGCTPVEYRARHTR